MFIHVHHPIIGGFKMKILSAPLCWYCISPAFTIAELGLGPMPDRRGRERPLTTQTLRDIHETGTASRSCSNSLASSGLDV